MKVSKAKRDARSTLQVMALLVSLWMVSGSLAESREMYLGRLLWKWDYSEEAELSFLDPEDNSIPEDIYGVIIGRGGELLVSERIADQLLVVSSLGEIVIRAGQQGDGPEDHRTLGEPLIAATGHYAVFDCSFARKLVMYGNDGSFAGNVALEAFPQYIRVLGCGKGYAALAMRASTEPDGGWRLRSYLVSLNANGSVRDSLKLKEVTLPPPGSGREMREEEFETLPKLAADSTGRIYLQRDLYKWEIECRDANLSVLWIARREVKARRRSADEISSRRDEMMMKFKPAEQVHVIRKLIPRAGGILWIETDGTGLPDGVIEFSQWGPHGEQRADVRVRGLPDVPGRYVLEGEFLFWTRPADWQRTPDLYNGQPYAAMYHVTRELVGGDAR